MTKIIPVALILIGLFMWRYPARASFNRRNTHGIEIFKSYGDMRMRRLFEGLIRFSGAILILAGIGHFIVPEKYSHSHIAHPDRDPKADLNARH